MIGDGLIERMNHAGIRRDGLTRIDRKPLPADTDRKSVGEDVCHDMVNLRRENGTVVPKTKIGRTEVQIGCQLIV